MNKESVKAAVAILDDSNTPYFLVVGDDTRTITICNIDKADKPMLRKWLITGHWNKLLKQQLDKLK